MKKTWWKESIIYQVYPRSFKDSNGDGIGDIPGVISKLDYIKSLGVDIIWLCPVYESPNDDNGYDISNYRAIHPEFGTMQDFDNLLKGVHDRGMKLIMDVVANHTSDEHAWFEESRSSKDNPKRDFYIWKPGKDGTEPNNWMSFFGGKAWQYDEQTEEYYLHLFTKKQPDLNWENPEVRREVFDQMKFWVDKGVDGFRLDVISLISKRNYEDTPYSEFNETIAEVYANGPRIHEFLKEMNKEVLANHDVMTVGEGPGITLENGLNYVGDDREELNMIFHFDHMFIDHGPQGKFDTVPVDFIHFKKVFGDWDKKLGTSGWNSIFLGNHDFPRIVSRFANDEEYWEEASKLLALMLLSMRGTPYIYQGDEFGMTNVTFDTIDDYRDVETLNVWKETQENSGDLDKLMKAIHWQGRDNARTPVQWDDSANAGFTSGEPWIKVNPNYESINAKSQEMNPRSVLHFYRKMITIRKTYPVLVYGDFEIINEDDASIFAYYRQDEEYHMLIVLNFSSEDQSFALEQEIAKAELIRIVSNYRQSNEVENGAIVLQPWEGIMYKIKKTN